MARAKKCDRCDKLIDRDLDNKYWNRKSYDLCPECMKELESFLKGGHLMNK